MKAITTLFVLLLGLVAATATAQPFRTAPPDHRPPPGERMEGREPFSPVRRMLVNLRERNPAEYDRLQQLRITDPEAFRVEIETALQGAFMERLKKTRPSVYEALLKLTDEDRTWIAQRIGRVDGPPRKGGIESSPPPEGKPSTNLRSLVRDYRHATQPDDRLALRDQIRKELEAHYDERLGARQAQLEDLREKLVDLELALKEGEHEREAFIDEKIDALLGPAPKR